MDVMSQLSNLRCTKVASYMYVSGRGVMDIDLLGTNERYGLTNNVRTNAYNHTITVSPQSPCVSIYTCIDSIIKLDIEH
jgi:hypothetical protein